MSQGDADRSCWIFAYGSLLWRPSFTHLESRPARVRGFSRRFWQGSTDHRGHPGAPGRVVTLLPDERGSCWGRAYRVASTGLESVLSQLDFREQGGYERREVELHFAASHVHRGEGQRSTATGLTYIATPANPNYLGPAPLEEIAAQVLASRGPSGDNREYVLRLAASLREIGATDPHVFQVEALVRAPVREMESGTGTK